VTNKLISLVSLKMPERSVAKSAKLRVIIENQRYFVANLRFALFASLRSAIFSKIKSDNFLVILPALLVFFLRCELFTKIVAKSIRRSQWFTRRRFLFSFRSGWPSQEVFSPDSVTCANSAVAKIRRARVPLKWILTQNLFRKPVFRF
jgi:hypothetical protein